MMTRTAEESLGLSRVSQNQSSEIRSVVPKSVGGQAH